MKTLSFAILVLTAAVQARAQAGPAARMGAQLGRTPQISASAFPPSDAVPVPQGVPAPASSAVVPSWLWATLKAPDAPTLAALSSRIPGLKTATVRVLTIEAADALLADAAARGQSPLDFFTDPGFRGEASFYLDQATMAALFAHYDIRGLTPPSGITKDGRPYAVQGFVVGGGRIDILYNLDQFTFENPVFPGHTYKLAAHVIESIQGPGDIGIQGIWVRFGLITPEIERVTKLSPTKSRVETSYGSLNKPVFVIRRR
ncbi:MAG: hypothetical protein ACHQ2Z_01830 [Elusimicrobiota bacterium]